MLASCPQCQGLPAPTEAGLCEVLPCSQTRPGSRPGSRGPGWLWWPHLFQWSLRETGLGFISVGAVAALRGLSMEGGQLWERPPSTSSSPRPPGPCRAAPLVLQLGLPALLSAGDCDLGFAQQPGRGLRLGAEQRLA